MQAPGEAWVSNAREPHDRQCQSAGEFTGSPNQTPRSVDVNLKEPKRKKYECALDPEPDSDLEIVSFKPKPATANTNTNLLARVHEEVDQFRLDRLRDKLVQRSQCNTQNTNQDTLATPPSKSDAAPVKKLRRSMCSYFD